MCFEQTLRHTHTQTKLNTDNPLTEDQTPRPIANYVLQTLVQQKAEQKHRNTHRKTHRYKPEGQSRLPTASHGPCIRTPLFPKPGVDNDFIFSIN